MRTKLTERLRQLDRRGEAAFQRWTASPSPRVEAARVFWGRHFLTGRDLNKALQSWGFGHGVLGALAWSFVLVSELLDGHWQSAGFWAVLTVIYLGLIFWSLTVPVRGPDD